MAAGRFDVPMVGVLAHDKSKTSLVLGSGVGAKDVVAKTRASVYAGAIRLSWYSGFGGEAQVYVLLFKALADLGQLAVVAILNVVCG